MSNPILDYETAEQRQHSPRQNAQASLVFGFLSLVVSLFSPWTQAATRSGGSVYQLLALLGMVLSLLGISYAVGDFVRRRQTDRAALVGLLCSLIGLLFPVSVVLRIVDV